MSPRRHAGASLGPAELERYSRHLLIPEVGLRGQERLKAGRALVVGTGGLGSPVAMYLAAAGVGRLGLVDFDRVDASNLHRQVLFGTPDTGRPKLEAARERIAAQNPFVETVLHPVRLAADNALGILRDYDVIIDGSDNFPTRYLVNDACVLLGKPNVYGSIFRFEGQVSVFDGAKGPCYRCLFPEPPPPGAVPSCAEAGVLGVLPGIVGTLQANEAIKLLLGVGEPLLGRLLLVDALGMRFREVRFGKDSRCPVCGPEPTIRELIDYDVFCGLREEGGEVTPEIRASDLSRVLDRVLVIDVREDYEAEIARIPGSRLIPLGELRGRFDEIDRAADVVVYCRSGIRSARAAAWLRDAGFPRVRNLRGGILAWSDEVDPSVPKY